MRSSNSWHDDDGIGVKFNVLFDAYRKLFDRLLSKSKDLGDIVRFLPGIVVQMDYISKRGMAELYRIKPDLLKRLIKSPIEPLRLDFSDSEFGHGSGYVLDDYLSGFLQEQDRSQLYYCDPILQHTSICRHFLFLLDARNASDHHWQSYVFCLI